MTALEHARALATLDGDMGEFAGDDGDARLATRATCNPEVRARIEEVIEHAADPLRVRFRRVDFLTMAQVERALAARHAATGGARA